MSFRLISTAILFSVSTAVAQAEVPPNKPKKPASDVQEPVRQKSSGDIISELQREKARLLQEIEYAKQRVKNANKMLAEKLGSRGQTFRSIDAGLNRPAQPVGLQMQKARVILEDEDGKFPPEVIMVVNGLPVQQAEYNSMMQYLQSLSNTGDNNMRAQRALFELIRVYSVAAAFRENSAEGQVSEVYANLQQGKPIADVAKTYGTVMGASEDGSVTVTRNSFLGIQFEQAAFALKEGEYSKPFRNVFGFVVVGVDKIEKGASPELDKVVCHAVQVTYSADQEALNKAQAAASRGQVTVLVRDDKILQQLPAMYRPASANPPSVDRNAQLIQRLEAIETQIQKLAAEGTEANAERIAELKKQRDAIRAALEEKIQDQVDSSDAPGKPAPVKPGKVIKKGDVKKVAPVKK